MSIGLSAVSESAISGQATAESLLLNAPILYVPPQYIKDNLLRWLDEINPQVFDAEKTL